jgi:hypothetical protein
VQGNFIAGFERSNALGITVVAGFVARKIKILRILTLLDKTGK